MFPSFLHLIFLPIFLIFSFLLPPLRPPLLPTSLPSLPLLLYSCSPPFHWTLRSNGWTNQPSLLVWHTPRLISSDWDSEEKTLMTRTYYDVLTVHTHTFLIRYMNFVHDKRKGKEKKNLCYPYFIFIFLRLFSNFLFFNLFRLYQLILILSKCWLYYPEDDCPFYRCTGMKRKEKKKENDV